MTSGVIITSAKYQSALAMVRCLGKRGIKVACGEDRRARTTLFPIAFYSKHCTERFIYPSYEDNEEEFIKAIISFAKKNVARFSTLIPVDAETLIISKHKHKIEAAVPHIKIPIHQHKYLSLANNKAKVMTLASEIGIPTPKTLVPISPDEVEEIACEMTYPVVIKLATSKGSKGFSIVYSKKEILKEFNDTNNKYPVLAGSELPMIQEYIPGIGYGVSCLFNHGELRAKFTHRRLRESAATGGPSVLRISDSHPEMEDYAIRLLEKLEWHGVAMVEFRLDERDNTPKLMEINPRFWGSLHLAITAGVEFPWLLYQMALHGDVNPVTDYRLGVQARFLWGDVRSFPSNFAGASSKIRFMKEFFAINNVTYDDLSLQDPAPALVQIINPIARLLATGHMVGE